MNCSSVPFITSRGMNIYDPLHQINSWIDGFEDDGFGNISAPTLLDVGGKIENQFQWEDSSHGAFTPSSKYEHEISKSSEKSQRRLAQNRDAARKCRLRKKAYIQQLESSRLKLIQLEQELERAKQQGLPIASEVDRRPSSSNANSGIVAFETEYGKWLEEQKRQICELKDALQAHTPDAELKILVDACMEHYSDLFRMKANVAKADVFYVMCGMWKSSAERFFSWIGGFRPSELLKVLVPLLEPLSDKQLTEISGLRRSCQQVEDALTQGMEKLQHALAETVAAGIQIDEGSNMPQMNTAVEKMEALVRFLNQADHLRKETLQQMHHILTVRQAASGLLVLGEYFQRLKALSSLWANRRREPA